MEIQETREGAVTVVKPVGALTGPDAECFKAHVGEVLRRSLGRFVVDVSAVPYLDSKGLEVIADTGDELADTGSGLRLCGANETIREALELTEIAPLVEHFADVQSGVRSFL